VEGDAISLPLGGAPSTHILKPAVERFAGVVFNEAYCMRLAATVGLPVAKTEIRRVEDVEYFLVERYDRTQRQSSEGIELKRLHQEDFCQALGIVSENKYQKEGGPSLKQCFALLREVSSAPVLDLARLLDAVIFNFLVGNNDAHAKNFSLLYHGGGAVQQEIRLAPLYDVVSTHHYPELTREMAMRIGGEYVSDRVTRQDFEQLAIDARLAKPLVNRRVSELAESVISSLGNTGIEHTVAYTLLEQIRIRCETVRNRW
jgi:serine/threonine-protein kinase HipA